RVWCERRSFLRSFLKFLGRKAAAGGLCRLPAIVHIVEVFRAPHREKAAVAAEVELVGHIGERGKVLRQDEAATAVERHFIGGVDGAGALFRVEILAGT